VKALLILLIICTGVIAQSRDDLKKKYGQTVSETFLIRPGIIVTASYNSTGQITEFLITPQLTGLIKSKSRGLSLETLNELIDELIPMSERGRGLFGGGFIIGCMPRNDCYGSYMEYEKIIIYYNAGPNREANYAVIQWRK
jgi:hypothetical protein